MSTADLPEHTIRVSDRARRVRLVITPADGLVVVVPRRFPRAKVPGILRGHAAWIARTMARTAPRRAELAALATEPPPDRIEMPGLGLVLPVSYRPSAAAGVRARLGEGEVVLTGRCEDADACREALRRAVSRVAAERLPLLLGGIEAETGWRATAVTVRRQRGRWGSCTSAGAVSLNEALVFLPPRLVRFVLVHELAHTLRMDHSPAFWELVGRHDAHWREARRELRDGWRHVPAWAHRG